MPVEIVPDAIAPTQWTHVVDDAGRVWLAPTATVEHFLSQGITSIPIIVKFAAPAAASRPLMTLTEAARAHLADMPPVGDTEAEQRRALNRARVRVSRACDRGEILGRWMSGKRLIDPTSLDAWRLKMRERELAAEDEE